MNITQSAYFAMFINSFTSPMYMMFINRFALTMRAVTISNANIGFVTFIPEGPSCNIPEDPGFMVGKMIGDAGDNACVNFINMSRKGAVMIETRGAGSCDSVKNRVFSKF